MSYLVFLLHIRPVPLGMIVLYGVPYIGFLVLFLQHSLNVMAANALAFSVLIVFVMPFKFRNLFENLTVVCPPPASFGLLSGR